MSTAAAIDCESLQSDVLCFTNLRWHWMPSRYHEGFVAAARDRRVFIVEEPVFVPGAPVMDVETPHERVTVARPCLPYALLGAGVESAQRALLDAWLSSRDIRPAVAWYHAPTSFGYTSHLTVPMIVYDRALDPSTNLNERFEVASRERELLARADVVYMERGAAFERMRRLHPDVRETPASGGMAAFFATSRRRDAIDTSPRASTSRASLPGDRPREERPHDLQLPWIQAGAERRQGWEEPRLQRGP